jgi:hypothetical protein
MFGNSGSSTYTFEPASSSVNLTISSGSNTSWNYQWWSISDEQYTPAIEVGPSSTPRPFSPGRFGHAGPTPTPTPAKQDPWVIIGPVIGAVVMVIIVIVIGVVCVRRRAKQAPGSIATEQPPAAPGIDQVLEPLNPEDKIRPASSHGSYTHPAAPPAPIPAGYPQGYPQWHPQGYPQGYAPGYPQAYPPPPPIRHRAPRQEIQNREISRSVSRLPSGLMPAKDIAGRTDQAAWQPGWSFLRVSVCV